MLGDPEGLLVCLMNASHAQGAAAIGTPNLSPVQMQYEKLAMALRDSVFSVRSRQCSRTSSLGSRAVAVSTHMPGTRCIVMYEPCPFTAFPGSLLHIGVSQPSVAWPCREPSRMPAGGIRRAGGDGLRHADRRCVMLSPCRQSRTCCGVHRTAFTGREQTWSLSVHKLVLVCAYGRLLFNWTAKTVKPI